MKSNKYRLINSSDLINKCDTTIKELGYTFDRKIVQRRGTTHTITYKINSNLSILGDTVQPMVMITNSYQGETSLRVQFGYFRLVCSNGLSIPNIDENANVIRIRHVIGTSTEEKLKTLEYEIAASIQKSFEYIATLEKTLSRPMTVETRDNIINGLKMPKNTLKLIKARLDQPTRPDDDPNTLWGVWNIVNESNRIMSRTENAEMTRNENMLANIIKLAA